MAGACISGGAGISGARVLVTGGAGYLGAVLCERLLDEGYRVAALDNLTYGQHSLLHLCAHPAFEFILGDARDEDVVRRCARTADILIPLAAIVGAPACDRDPWLARSVNVDAVRLLNRLRSERQLIVYPMTNSGYGIQSRDDYCSEETPLEPTSLYGRTKREAESELFQAPNVISLRLATVFGISPRMRLDLLVNHFVHAAITDGYIVVYEKDFKRNYIHIRDVADCFVHCIENAGRMAGKPYNVGLDSANMSKEALALKVKEHVPTFLIHFAQNGSDPDKRDYVVSSQRLRETGFEAKRTLDEGIHELLKGYQMMRSFAFRNA